MERTDKWLDSFRTNKSVPKNKLAKTISISSGKGGVGKTTFALKMARELANEGHKVLLIDCDYNLSNTLVKLGLPLNNNFYHLVSAEKDFYDCLYQEGNFYLLAGCNGNIDLFNKNLEFDKIVMDIVDERREDFDYILLDCPAGLNERILNINAYTDQRILIINPDKSSITDSYSLIKLLSLKYQINKNHLVINRVISKSQLKKILNTICVTSKRYLNCECIPLGGIREYENKLQSIDKNVFFNTKSLIHKNFLKIILRYSEKYGGKIPPKERLDLPLFRKDEFEQDVQSFK